MSASGHPLEFRRLRAPQADRGILFEPPPQEFAALLGGNVDLCARQDIDLQGRRCSQLSGEARRDVTERAMRYTRAYRDVDVDVNAPHLLLAGHQPELFHPGVWFKNFVLGGLARGHHAVGINLLIDNDLLDNPSLRVPIGSVAESALGMVAYDRPQAVVPWEERPIVNRELFDDFGREVAERVARFVPDPLIRTFWPLVIEQADATGMLGASLAQGRHRLEGEWGLSTLELPLSTVCETAAFHWFAAHLLAQLPKFQRIYNESLLEYRRAARIRSRNHPVPALAADDGWLEAPFWIWRTDAPRRRRLFVRFDGRELRLGDRDAIDFRLPLAADADATKAVDVLAQLPARNIKLRPRALTTTMFARLMLADVFLHGIGGAKYDELTDLIVRRFFGIEPPAVEVLSATLRLPIEHPSVSLDELRFIDRRLRELAFHPEKFLPGSFASADEAEDARRLTREKAEWIARDLPPSQLRERWLAIRRVNGALQRWIDDQRADLVAKRQRDQRVRRAQQVLESREYAFCLHPAERLRDFLLEFTGATS